MSGTPLIFLALASLALSFPFHPKQQFTTDFKVWTQYNATLSFNSNSAAEPFIWSEPLSPIGGKMYFDWTQQGFRFELQAGPGAPYDLETTIIVHPTNYKVQGTRFNVTWNIYEYLSDGRCWWQSVPQYNLPTQIDQLDPNITFVSIQTVDGYSCAVFNSSEGNVYAVRISDLTLIRAQVPYLGELPLPIPVFLIGGGGDSLSWIDMYNPVPGPVDPKYFAVPSGNCIYTNYTYYPGAPILSNPTEVFTNLLQEGLLSTRKPKAEPANQKALRQSVPTVAQAFTAKYKLTVFAEDVPPFQSYNISGKIAFDFGAFGFYGMINDIEGPIPFDLQAGFIIYPDQNGVELLFVSPEGQCYSIFFFQWLWTYLLPPFAIPPDALFIGETVVNGDRCTMWNYYWDRSVTLYVRESDNMIVQVKGFNDPTWTYEGANVILTDIEPSVDPSIYSRPPTCTDTIVWNHSWQSHLPWYWCSPMCSF